MHLSPRVLAGALALGGVSLLWNIASVRAQDAQDAQEAQEQRPGVALADFHDPEDNARWRMINDDVMGGRSLGAVRFEAGVMVFEGSINTDGGGFSSVRRPLEPGVLRGMDRVVLRVRALDDRPYRVNFRDRSRSGGSWVLHRCELPIAEPGVWQSVEVRFADLVPSVRGDPVDLPAFNPGEAVEIGLILNDTGDGPFGLEVSAMWAAAPTDAGDGPPGL